MRAHRLTAAIAVVIAALLAIIVFHAAIFAPASSSAAAGAIEYKVVKLAPQFAGNSEAILNQMGAQGWEIAYGVGEYILMKRNK